jgi:DNA-binding transcriptional LysR family regulator
MTMELRHIRYFLAVAEERHFTRAAAKVGIGQPPLSQQIKDLEAEIGAPLFRRLAHGAELTAAGEAFLAGVSQMPFLGERAIKAAQRASRGETGSLRLGFSSSAAFDPVVPGAIRAFRRAFADVELTLEEAATTRLVAGLQDGSLDVVFLRPGFAGSDALQVRPLSEEPMVVALPARHPAAGRREVDLASLKQDPFLLFPRALSPAFYDSIIAACRKAGFEPMIGPARAADRLCRHPRRRRARRVDHAGLDESAESDRRHLSADRRASADGSARARPPTGRNLAHRAQLHSESDVLMPDRVSSTLPTGGRTPLPGWSWRTWHFGRSCSIASGRSVRQQSRSRPRARPSRRELCVWRIS